MSIKQKIKVKTFTGSGSFDVREEMLKDSTDLFRQCRGNNYCTRVCKVKTKRR
jgi:hypothetical protein